MFKNEVLTPKSLQTRELLYQVAIAMIAERGFEKTTMRAIAKEAGVATGASYYYFKNKESIIAEYYRQSHEDHIEKLGQYLESERSFERRLEHVITTKIQVALPYQEMARALYRVAADPKSPLSPFSEESSDIRTEVVDLFEEVVVGSREVIHPRVLKLLPTYLWFYMMGVILHWIYDDSKGAKRTFALIKKTVPLIASTNKMMGNPLAAPFRNPILKVLEELQPNLKKKKEK